MIRVEKSKKLHHQNNVQISFEKQKKNNSSEKYDKEDIICSMKHTILKPMDKGH